MEKSLKPFVTLVVARSSKTIMLALFMLLFSASGISQKRSDYDALLEKYKAEESFIVKSVRTIRIVKSDTGLIIYEDVYLEKMLVGEKNDDIKQDVIPYNFFSSVEEYEAYTLRPFGNTWERFRAWNVEDVLHVGDYFFNDSHFKIITFPSVSQGSRTILKYTKTYREPWLWGTHFLSSGEAVETGEVHVIYPDGVQLRSMMHNTDSTIVKHSMKRKGKNNIATWNFSFDKSFETEGLPVMYSAPMLMIGITQVEKDDETNYYLSDNNQLAKWYHSNFLKAGNKPDSAFYALTDSITQGMTDQKIIIKALFDWVSSNIKYLGVEDGYNGFIPRSTQYILQRHYGDCKDKSNLLVEMLRYKGINAWPAFTGTTDLPFDHDSIVSPVADNHVIVAVDTGAAPYWFLDPTQTIFVPGFPPLSLQGKSTIVVKENGDAEVCHFPLPHPDASTLLQITDFELSGKSLYATTDVNGTGYFYLYLKTILDEQTLKESVSSGEYVSFGDTRQMIPESIEDIIIDNEEGNVSYTMNSHRAAPVTVSRSGVFVNPYPLYVFGLGEFSEIKKQKQMMMTFPATWTFDIYLGFDDSLELQTLPSDEDFGNDNYRFVVQHTPVGDHGLDIQCVIRISKMVFREKDMADFQEFAEKIKKTFDRSVILHKKQ